MAQQREVAEPSPPTKHRPLQRGLREQITAQLREDIVSGRAAAGDQIVEREIAARFGVSHAPVREALLELTIEGLLVSRRHVGVKVAPRSPPPIPGLFGQLRRTIETFSIEFIFDQIDAATVRYWEALVVLQRQAAHDADWSWFVALDYTFHESILLGTRHADILRAWRSIFPQARIFIAERRVFGDLSSRICDQHTALIERCRNHDLQGAYGALESNLQFELSLS